jgi:hypothetical protein
MAKQTIGTYAFVTPNWKELDYPLDLWIEHHVNIFDQVALVCYGDIDIPSNKKLVVNHIQPIGEEKFSFYVIGKTKAQELLSTDWKVLLDIDEFIPERINPDKLDPKYVYPLFYHNLYGNLSTDIGCVGLVLPSYQARIHYGNKKVLGDGACVNGKYDTRFAISARTILNRIKFALFPNSVIPQPLRVPKISFDVWHTGTVRNPLALNEKWKRQTMRALNEDYHAYDSQARHLDKAGFDYTNFRSIFSASKLKRVDRNLLPKCLTDNSKRFDWVQFKDSDYSD